MASQNRRNCEHLNCIRTPYYGFERARFCSAHKQEGMFDVRNRRCEVRDCTRRPYYAMEGEKARMCSLHKEEGMLDVQSRRCTYPTCVRRPYYAPPGQKALLCFEHKEEGMVDVQKGQCEVDGCSRKPYYGLPDCKAVRCSTHKEEGDVDVQRRRRCGSEGCLRQPCFAYEGQRAIFCSLHKAKGMEDVKNRRCEAESCKKQPIYGWIGGKGRFCSGHKEDGMTNVQARKCEVADCRLFPSCGLDGKATHCESHRGEGMKLVKPPASRGQPRTARLAASTPSAASASAAAAAAAAFKGATERVARGESVTPPMTPGSAYESGSGSGTEHDSPASSGRARRGQSPPKMPIEVFDLEAARAIQCIIDMSRARYLAQTEAAGAGGGLRRARDQPGAPSPTAGEYLSAGEYLYHSREGDDGGYAPRARGVPELSPHGRFEPHLRPSMAQIPPLPSIMRTLSSNSLQKRAFFPTGEGGDSWQPPSKKQFLLPEHQLSPRMPSPVSAHMVKDSLLPPPVAQFPFRYPHLGSLFQGLGLAQQLLAP